MPSWEGITNHLSNIDSDQDQSNLWDGITEAWLEELKNSLSNTFTIHHSDNFVLLTDEEEKYTSLFLAFLERTLTRINNTLPNIVSDNGFGKHVVLIFDDIDKYYSYISNFYSEDGIYGLSSGVYVNAGYGHFAFPHQELTYAEPIAAHELTHAMLAHLPIPVWLNEGIAVNIENAITGGAPFHMTDELLDKHIRFWGKEKIQAFWSGKSFNRADEGQELSYHLAQFSVHALNQDYEPFVEFVNRAHYSDGGEAAALEIFEGSLGDLIMQFFGEGDWSPDPGSWNK